MLNDKLQADMSMRTHNNMHIIFISTFSRSDSLSSFRSCLRLSLLSVIDLENLTSWSSITKFLGVPIGAVIQWSKPSWRYAQTSVSVYHINSKNKKQNSSKWLLSYIGQINIQAILCNPIFEFEAKIQISTHSIKSCKRRLVGNTWLQASWPNKKEAILFG